MSSAEETAAVRDVCERMARTPRPDPTTADRHLSERARILDARFLSGKASPTGVRFSPRLTASFGNANLLTRVIQIAARLRRAPHWVIDYLLLHELAHLVEPSHTRRFWGLVDQYRYAERAKGYLICISQLEE